MEENFVHLVADYVEETRPLAEEVQGHFLALEQEWEQGGSGGEPMAAIRSALHSIKGNSAMMGLVPIRDVAHALEDLCAATAGDERTRGQSAIDALLRGVDLVLRLIGRVSETRSGLNDAGSQALRSEVEEFLEYVHRCPSVGSGTDSAAANESLGKDPEGAPIARATPAGDATSAHEAKDSGRGAETTVRVPFQQIDELLEHVSEMLMAHSALDGITRELAARAGILDHAMRLDAHAADLARNTRSIQRTLLRMRMLPVKTLFSRYARFVRDLAQTRGQPLQLEVTGGDTTVDKAIIDRLGEPLTHLVQNAVAHGVETPAERKRAGKPETATVRLGARIEGEQVILTVGDDGRGLDLNAIRAKAEKQGHDTAALSERELARLIFSAGFSTRSHVDALAGRGVGLDVVERRVQALGGHVDVESAPGQGTEFSLRLPITLSVLKGLLVDLEHDVFVLPMTHVEETVRVAGAQIDHVYDKGYLRWRGHMVPLIDTPAQLGLGPASSPSALCLIVGALGQYFGLLVPGVLGHQEIVVKPIDEVTGQPPWVSGATILGDGRVVLILDPLRLAQETGVRAPIAAA